MNNNTLLNKNQIIVNSIGIKRVVLVREIVWDYSKNEPAIEDEMTIDERWLSDRARRKFSLKNELENE
jgi:hypothetical protein